MLTQRCVEMDERMTVINNAAEYVSGRLEGRKPEVAVVLGSGLGKLADMIEDPVVIPYSEIPGFPVSTVIGHKGNFVCGQLGGKTVLAMQGRFDESLYVLSRINGLDKGKGILE